MNAIKSIISPEDSERYQGKLVALDDWSQEGSHPACVVAAGENIGELENQLRLIGKGFQDVIVFYVSPEKTSYYAHRE